MAATSAVDRDLAALKAEVATPTAALTPGAGDEVVPLAPAAEPAVPAAHTTEQTEGKS